MLNFSISSKTTIKECAFCNDIKVMKIFFFNGKDWEGFCTNLCYDNYLKTKIRSIFDEATT